VAKKASVFSNHGGALQQLKLAAWAQVQSQARVVSLAIDAAALQEAQRLDGCSALKTDVSAAQASPPHVHERYKDLTLVEQNFRTWKTV
jgi:hypothetical protein